VGKIVRHFNVLQEALKRGRGNRGGGWHSGVIEGGQPK